LYEDGGELEAHIVDDSGTEISVRDRTPLPLNTWHHVAFVADGGVLRLYRNGIEVDSKPYLKLHRDSRIRALAIGTKLNRLGTAPEERDFNMWDSNLDELAIFNNGLSAGRSGSANWQTEATKAAYYRVPCGLGKSSVVDSDAVSGPLLPASVSSATLRIQLSCVDEMPNRVNEGLAASKPMG
jgi:hypothetical protein